MTVFFACLSSTAGCVAFAESENWAALEHHSPFGGDSGEPAKAAPPSQLELHGVLIEGQDRWFCVYDSLSKKADWVKESDATGPMKIKSYDPLTDAVTVETNGNLVVVALKEPFGSDGVGVPVRPGVLVAATGLSTPPAVAPQPPSSEIKRFAMLAELIQQRRNGLAKARG